MNKKFLVSLAAVAALSTSAMAYDVSELSSMKTSGVTPKSMPIFDGFNQTETSNSLIFPAYKAGNGWETTIRVINTSSTNGMVAKVVLYAAKDSHEVVDFNIYLSKNDVWVGKIKINDEGQAEVYSSDDSTPLENGSLATEANPFKKEIGNSPTGYVEVIGMASTKQDAHKDHAGLRKAYQKFANYERTATETPDLIFKEGVIQNNVATLPYVEINTTKGYDVDGDKKFDYNFTAPKSVLTGDVRITDTVNGKDMDMMAYKLKYDTNITNDDVNATEKFASLVYLEGEKANLADLAITTKKINNKDTSYYDVDTLEKMINKISSSTAYITYGDAPVNNMYALLTNPFKRIYVQASLDASDKNSDKATNYVLDGKIQPNTSDTNASYYTDASTDKDKNINYGSTSLIAQIFDESEKPATAGQFSPANTPTIKLENEVETTGFDVTDQNTLAYYLNQGKNQGFKRGFIRLTNAKDAKIPGIMTQMLATQAGGKVVTNWIVPQSTNSK